MFDSVEKKHDTTFGLAGPVEDVLDEIEAGELDDQA
jgi:hypothetical protein